MDIKKPIVRRPDADLYIRAYAQSAENPDSFHGISFCRSDIRYLMEVSDGISAVVLKDKTFIPVLLSWPDLEDRVHNIAFQNHGVLDLTEVTGKVVRNARTPKLAQSFNDVKKKGPTITAILREPDEESTFIKSFSEKDVESYTPSSDDEYARGKNSVIITFNKEATPNDNYQAMLDMPYNDYMAQLEIAKRYGRETLDLCSVFVNNPTKYGVKL